MKNNSLVNISKKACVMARRNITAIKVKKSKLAKHFDLEAEIRLAKSELRLPL